MRYVIAGSAAAPWLICDGQKVDDVLVSIVLAAAVAVEADSVRPAAWWPSPSSAVDVRAAGVSAEAPVGLRSCSDFDYRDRSRHEVFDLHEQRRCTVSDWLEMTCRHGDDACSKERVVRRFNASPVVISRRGRGGQVAKTHVPVLGSGRPGRDR